MRSGGVGCLLAKLFHGVMEVHLGAHGDERDQLSSLGIAKNTNECVRARAVHGN